jgi:5-methylthioadenosine/S-adenosylhomocysteine deaminase
MMGSEARTLLRVAAAVPEADADPVQDAGILIEGPSICSVGPFADVRRAYPLAPERDASYLVALPGFVDAHSHGRGLTLSEQGVREGPLELFLAQLTACTPLDPHDDMLVAGADLLATGVTAAQVFFHSLAPVDEYRMAAGAAAAGLAESGVGNEFVLGFSDQDEFLPPTVDGVPAGAEPLWSPERGLDADEFLAVYDEFAAHDGLHVTLGPVAPQWCSDRVWEGVAARTRLGARVHTHLLESGSQRAMLDPSPVETLQRFGVLGGRLSAAHAVWLTEEEVADVATAGAALVHCPGSNLKLAGATAPVRAWLDAGVNVAIGLDSNARADPPDIFDELRAALDVARNSLSQRDVFRLATTGGARALGRGDLGRLDAGYAANIVLVPVPERKDDLVTELVDQLTRHDVVEVWANGSMCVAGGRLLQRRAVEQARTRLRAQLAADAPARRRRLAQVSALEPWLSEVWALDGAPSHAAPRAAQ